MIVSALASRLINPGGRPSARALRDAVDGRVILVTGASHGIGREAALQLAAAGATVVGTARSADRLDDLAATADGMVDPRPCDLTDQDAAAALADAVLDDHGHVDVVVSNAGKSIRRSVALSYERFHDVTRTVGVNYLGPVRLLLALLPSMRARRAGHVVNVSTVGVLLPPAPRWAAYQASKSAFDVWLRSVAAETARDGVTATSVYLGLVDTRMSAPNDDFSWAPALSAQQAAGVVCDAVVRRPSVIAPWWATGASALNDLARAPTDAVVRRLIRTEHDVELSHEAGGSAA